MRRSLQTCIRGHRPAWLAALLLAIGPACAAKADVIIIGSPGPNFRITQVVANFNNITNYRDLSYATSSAVSFPEPLGGTIADSASYDLNAGTLRSSSSAVRFANGNALSAFNLEIPVSGNVTGAIAHFYLDLRGTYSVHGWDNGYGMQEGYVQYDANMQTNVGGLYVSSHDTLATRDPEGMSGTIDTTIDLAVPLDFGGSVFTFSAALYALSNNGWIDLAATLRSSVPPGVTLQTDLHFQNDAQSVPAPGPAVLAIGLLGLAGLRRRRT